MFVCLVKYNRTNGDGDPAMGWGEAGLADFSTESLPCKTIDRLNVRVCVCLPTCVEKHNKSDQHTLYKRTRTQYNTHANTGSEIRRDLLHSEHSFRSPPGAPHDHMAPYPVSACVRACMRVCLPQTRAHVSRAPRWRRQRRRKWPRPEEEEEGRRNYRR